MENEKIDNLETEFYTEIQNKNVKISDLKNLGASDILLKEEIMLRNIYGDKILENEESTDEIDATKKVVEKININEIEKIDEVKAFVEALANSENNQNIEVLLAKIRQEEE